MTKSIKAAIHETHGNPTEVLRVVEQPWPKPGADEVVVKMAAAPINPADLNSIEGKYPIRPALPATPGMEGAGTVVELGSAVRDLEVGSQVILPHGLGTWREACAVAANKLVSVPSEVEPIQAAMLKVNPITAWRMLHDFVSLQRGDWVIQNAANSLEPSFVAKWAFQLAQKFNGFYDNDKNRILHEPEEARQDLLVIITGVARRQLTSALAALGIEAPERM